MMLSGDYNIFHAGLLGQTNPGVRIVLGRIKLRRALFIFRLGNLAHQHNPFPAALDLFAVINPGEVGIYAPMNKHTEARFTPPFHPCIPILSRLKVGFAHLGGMQYRTGKNHTRYYIKKPFFHSAPAIR